jgi:NAD+ diphosphatase
MNDTHPDKSLAHRAVFAVTGLSARYPSSQTISPDALFILVSGQGIVVRNDSDPQVCWQEDPLKYIGEAGPVEYLGHRGETPWYAAGLPEDSDDIPGGRLVTNVRELYGQVPDDDLALASFAVRMIASAAANRFCGKCSHATEPVRTERAWRCPACGLVVYPRISPAIIVLIMRGEEILLARSPRFPPGMYSVIAGFAEPGETLEHAVWREVKEEVGIMVKNLRYFASEPWPFPDSLMIAFTAEYDTGEIAIDNNEIVSAGWYGRSNLPGLPASLSISRALIDRWIRRDWP